MSFPSDKQNSCANCGLSFHERWCKIDKCLFCTKYVPMRESRLQMINDARNCFLWAAWSNEADYYKIHVPYLLAWCVRWNIPETEEETEATEKLLKHKNWTRQYWH